MLVKDRPNLTRQALRSIYDHTNLDQFNLTIINDHSMLETTALFLGIPKPNWVHVYFSVSIGILGFLRNIGAQVSEKLFGRGDWLCFLDNDIAVFKDWLPHLVNAASDLGPGMVLGGQRHPYHKPLNRLFSIEHVDAVAGYSMFMSWSTWDRFGPFDANAKGIGQSEDWAFSQRVKAAHGVGGYVSPPVLSHTGITNSDGKPATGHEAFERFPGLIYE